MDIEGLAGIINTRDITAVYSIYNDLKSAEISHKELCSKDFLTPNLWKPIINNKNKLGIDVKSFGLLEDAERRVLLFNSEEEFGLDLIKIENKNKFLSLSHRDYMGGVLSLGIKRERMGDFILKGNICYFPCKEEISEYLLENINTIGKTKVTAEKVNKNFISSISVDFDDMVIELPSLRLDSIVSSIGKVSRSSADDLIKKGKVLWDYAEDYDKSHIIDIDSIITIRGCGKFKLVEEIGKTKKGNIKIYIKKFK